MEDQLSPESELETGVLGETAVIWSLLSRMAFRFWFLYFWGAFFPIVNPVVPWVAARVFRATPPLVVSGSGSGDKTHDWVSAFCVLCVAVAGTLLWSMLDRRRPNYIALQRWLHLLLRFSLGAILLQYGWMKIVPMQMPYPSLTRLLQPFGEFSPMGVLWSSVGASPAYEMFTGFVEVVAGILVLVPITSRFGALLCLAASTQIFVLNMTYDVPVKLYSFLLILRSLVLLVPDLPRLVKFFFSRGPVGAAPSGDLFVSPRKNRIALVLQILFTIGLIGAGGWQANRSWATYGGGATKPELYGIWNVERLVVDDELRQPLLTDVDSIRRIIFDRASSAAIQLPDGSIFRYTVEFDAKSQTAKLKRVGDNTWGAPLRYTRPANDALVLDGMLYGRKYHIEAKLFDLNRFPIVGRGFHWVQEYSFNR